MLRTPRLRLDDVAAAAAPKPGTSRTKARTPAGPDGVPPRSRRGLRVELPAVAKAGAGAEERIVKSGMHARRTAGAREATGQGAPERIVRAQTRRVEVVVADVEGRAAVGEDYAAAAARRLIYLVLVLEARGWEVADRGAGPGTGQVRKEAGVRIGYVGLGVASKGAAGVPGLLGAALGTGGDLGRVVDFDVAFLLKLWDELLDDVNLKVAQHV